MLSFGIEYAQFFHSFIALPMIQCLKLAYAKIRCSDVSSHYCCYGNRSQTVVNGEFECVPKTVTGSECCELMKLCHVIWF